MLLTSPFWLGSTWGRGIESAVGPRLHSILLSGAQAAGASAIIAPRSADVPQGLSPLHAVILQLKADLVGCGCTRPGTHPPHLHTQACQQTWGVWLQTRTNAEDNASKGTGRNGHSTLNFKRLFSLSLSFDYQGHQLPFWLKAIQTAEEELKQKGGLRSTQQVRAITFLRAVHNSNYNL